MKQYTVFEMSGADKKGVAARRFMNLNFTIPMVFIIPGLIETGFINWYYGAKAVKIMKLLNIAEMYFFIWGLVMYQVINKTVTRIVYNVDENTFTVTQMSTWRLKERTFTFKPEELIKHYKKSINPFIGYRSRRVEDGDLRFATELGQRSNFIDR